MTIQEQLNILWRRVNEAEQNIERLANKNKSTSFQEKKRTRLLNKIKLLEGK